MNRGIILPASRARHLAIAPAAPAQAPPASLELTGTIRDFSYTHPDFEDGTGDDRGMVEQTLGSDKKPVYAYAPPAHSPTTTGKTEFDQWFRDVAGVNQSQPL